MTFSVNKSIVGGKVSDYGCKLIYNTKGTPELSFTLIVEKPVGEQVFKSFIPVTVYGNKAETLAETLEASDLVLCDGEIGYKAAGGKDGKGGLSVTAYSVQVVVKAGAAVN